jgi:hypothetical protein
MIISLNAVFHPLARRIAMNPNERRDQTINARTAINSGVPRLPNMIARMIALTRAFLRVSASPREKRRRTIRFSEAQRPCKY